jgi:hypothetical protein
MPGSPQGIRFTKSTRAQIERPPGFIDRDDVCGAHIAGVTFGRLSTRSNDPCPRDQGYLGRPSRRSPVDGGYRFARIVGEQHFHFGSRKAIARRESPEPRELFAHS